MIFVLDFFSDEFFAGVATVPVRDIERYAVGPGEHIQHAVLALQSGGDESPLWESKGRATAYSISLLDGRHLDGNASACLTEVSRAYVDAVEVVRL